MANHSSSRRLRSSPSSPPWEGIKVSQDNSMIGPRHFSPPYRTHHQLDSIKSWHLYPILLIPSGCVSNPSSGKVVVHFNGHFKCPGHFECAPVSPQLSPGSFICGILSRKLVLDFKWPVSVIFHANQQHLVASLLYEREQSVISSNLIVSDLIQRTCNWYPISRGQRSSSKEAQ